MRLIDADAFKFRACTEYDCKDKPCEDCLDQYITKREIDNAPTVERPQGEWTTEKGSLEITCSVCNKGYFYHPKNHFYYNYCPNCGADMRGEENECKNDT